jgi:hypothetical protein
MVTGRQALDIIGEAPIDAADIDAVLELLDDPHFTVPFAARHRVSGRKPAP